MKRIQSLIFLLLLYAATSAQQILYVSPTGSASNSGTSISAPTTLQNALATVSAGGTIYMRGGTYNFSQTIVIDQNNNGTSSATKKVFAYTGETPVIDFSAQALADANRGLVVDGDYWHFKGLKIQGAGDNGVLLSGNSNIFENCVFTKNRDSGIQLSRYLSSNTSISQWPSNNLILNCESFDNKDASAENADGFAAKLTCGPGNIFRGCIAHHNSDDGWDFYAKSETGSIGAVTLENCVAYNNGALTDGTTSSNGDKNGFKLGGSGIAVNHIVRRCIAFNNGKHGFTDNNNPGNIEVSNNTSWNNKECNYNFRSGSTSTLRNNLSFNGAQSDKTFGMDVGTSNVWWKNGVSTNTGSLVVSSADFVSLTWPSVYKNADGSPELGNFLALASGSDMINAGVTSSGITYTGSAPDIGARESGSTSTPTSYTLTTAAAPSAGGSVTRSPNASSYTAGTAVTLTAVPASGYSFTGWSGGASGTNATITVTINANTTITANFTNSTGTTYTLTTTASPSAGGSITRSPNAASYTSGTVVTLTAVPASGYSFSGWSGDVSGTNATTTVTMSANRSVTASFTAIGSGNTLRIDDKSATGTGYCAANGSRQNSYAGADGGYYINLSNSSGQGIDWAVRVPAAGTYALQWRYANAGSSSATSARVLVNGAQAIASVAFPKTTAWTAWTTTASVNVNLVAGANKIRLETTVASEFANIDWIEITGNSPTEALCSTPVGGRVAQPIALQELAITKNAMNVFPNPANAATTVQLYNRERQQVTIDVFTAQGQKVLRVANAIMAPGVHNLPINCAKLPRGNYFISATLGNGKKLVQPLVVQ